MSKELKTPKKHYLLRYAMNVILFSKAAFFEFVFFSSEFFAKLFLK